MIVVLDTNVFISSFFGGNPRRIIDLWKSGRLTIGLSPAILEEYVEVLGRLGLANEPELKEILELLAGGAGILFTANPPELRVVKDDPDDDKFIACAAALKADIVVTGDKALRKVGSFGGIRILTPAEFLKAIDIY
ncbi:MAG: putative toxin-antitoxin system toxin component, PIN family [Candidatus Aminicenantes bacterium]|nr:putative toxin-antitoxin system toxin component, PIN family [Candidatus Aminicenantes bacterium]